MRASGAQAQVSVEQERVLAELSVELMAIAPRGRVVGVPHVAIRPGRPDSGRVEEAGVRVPALVEGYALKAVSGPCLVGARCDADGLEGSLGAAPENRVLRPACAGDGRRGKPAGPRSVRPVTLVSPPIAWRRPHGRPEQAGFSPVRGTGIDPKTPANRQARASRAPAHLSRPALPSASKGRARSSHERV
jgi:hypothetical protein